MSKKTNRLRRRLESVIRDKHFQANKSLSIENTALAMKLKRAEDEIRNLHRQMAEDSARNDNLKAFRVHVDQAMPFRGGSSIYQINVAFDLRALEFGIGMGFRDNVFNLAGQIRYLTEDLRHKIDRTIIEKLTADGVINRY
jgi:hypothetical protein